MSDAKNFFDSAGLSVEFGEVEVGETYPIYGMITEFLNDTPGSVKVMVNNNIRLAMMIEEIDKISLLKSRCFEPGIFVAKILEKGDIIAGDCTTVVFGRKQCTNVQ